MCPWVAAVLDRRVLGGRCPTLMLPGGSSPVGPVNPAGPDDPVDAGGPIGPCEALSSLFHEVLEPLEHSVLDHAGPAGRHVAVGPVGPLGTLSPSDCHPAGPAGPYVGPYETLNKVLEPLEHSVLDHADPAGQHAVIQEVLEPLEHLVPDAALGWWTYGGDTSSRSVRAFGSGNGTGRWTVGGDVSFGTDSPFGSECSPGRSTHGR